MGRGCFPGFIFTQLRVLFLLPSDQTDLMSLLQYLNIRLQQINVQIIENAARQLQHII